MIVVDTSVWIAVLNGAPTAPAQQCIKLLQGGADLALTDVVLTEILQGLRTDKEAQRVEQRLKAFPILRLDAVTDFVRAANLYRTARRSGITIRKTLDCLIASPCVREDLPLLHDDTDFDRLAACTPLRIATLP